MSVRPLSGAAKTAVIRKEARALADSHVALIASTVTAARLGEPLIFDQLMAEQSPAVQRRIGFGLGWRRVKDGER